MDNEKIAMRVARRVLASNGPVMQALEKEWNTLHYIESMLEDAAQRYDVAASYSGKPGERDARHLMNEIMEAKKELEHVSMKTFGHLVDLEKKFEREFGDVEDYIVKTRNEIFPI